MNKHDFVISKDIQTNLCAVCNCAADYPFHNQPAVGRKDDSGKDRWDLLPWKAVHAVVEVLTFGAKKYAPGNWRLVDDLRNRYFAAGLRHIYSRFIRNELIDQDSGKPHLACAICCLAFVLEIDLDEAESK